MNVVLHLTGLDPEGQKVAALASNGFSGAFISQDRSSETGRVEIDVEPVTDAAIQELVEHAEGCDGVSVEHVETKTLTFNDLLDRHLASLDSYVAAVEAERFRDWMVEHHPDVLQAWHQEHEVVWIRRAIGHRDHRDRQKARTRAKARQFHEATEKVERAGDYEALDPFAVPYVVDDVRNRKRVADMTGADHKFVASRYEASARQDQMLAAFHLAVSKKVGSKRTADVLSVEQYEDMYRSITGSDVA